MKRLRGCLGVFLIFFFGVLFGVVITIAGIHQKVRELVEGGPDKVVDVVVQRLKDDLHLDHDQQEMLQQIAIDTRIKLRTIRQKTQPEVNQTLNEATQKVRGILNPKQVKKFDEIVGQARARWKLDDRTDAAPAAPEPTAPSASPAPSDYPAPAPQPER